MLHMLQKVEVHLFVYEIYRNLITKIPFNTLVQLTCAYFKENINYWMDVMRV